MSITGRMEKEEVVFPYSGMLAFKKKAIPPFVITWMDTENCMLSERASQPVTEGQIVHDATYARILKWSRP